jgi:hypothetical protein
MRPPLHMPLAAMTIAGRAVRARYSTAPQVGGVVVDGGELFEGQRVAPGGQLAPGFAVPVLAQLAIAGGEIRRQRRVDDDVEVVPGDARSGGTLAVAVDDLFQFVEQFLGAADAEGRDEQAALVAEAAFAEGLQALPAILAAFVGAVAVGAFEDDDVGAVGRSGRWQQGGVGGAEVTGEDDALCLLAPLEIEFDVGRAEDVARRRQPDAQRHFAADDRAPLFVGYGDGLLADLLEKAADQRLVAGESDLQGIFEDQRQQRRRGLAADDRPAITGRQQPGDAPDMVDVHVGDDQRAHPIDGEGDVQAFGPGAFARGFGALKQAAVHQHDCPSGRLSWWQEPVTPSTAP